jgi:Flp pilus assembly protein TadD
VLTLVLSGCGGEEEGVLDVSGTPQERIARFEAALEQDPGDTEVLSRLAEALAEMGDYRASADRLLAAIKVDPEDPILRQQLGTVLGELGETAQAIEHLTKALEMVASPDVHVILGNLYVDQGDGEKAVSHYRQALVLDPDDIDAHYNLGVQLGKQGEQKEAEAHYRAVLEVDGAHAEAANNLGVALLLQDKRGESIQYFERAVRLEPSDEDARRNLAMALLGEARVDDAIAVLQDGLARTPEAPQLANYLAWVRATNPDAQHRDGAEAIRLAELACKGTQYSDANFLDTLAAAYAEAGRFDDAVATSKRALELAADRPTQAAEFRSRLALYEAGTAYREQ